MLVKVTAHGLRFVDAARRMDAQSAGVPRPRRQNEHPVSGQSRHPPRLPGRRLHDALHRRDAGAIPPVAAAQDRATQPAQLHRRRHRQRQSRLEEGPGVRSQESESGGISEAVPTSLASGQVPLNAAQTGTRDTFHELGAGQVRAWVREQQRLLVTDTTFRDAHQSLLATRMRTYDMLRVLPTYAARHAGLFSLEMWGGATFDTAMRFLKESPWDRLADCGPAVPTSSSRCCCARPTPSAIPIIPITSSRRSSRSRRRPASTCSASSTPQLAAQPQAGH